MKLRTTLPYKMEDMELISVDGAIVDMSSMNFPVPPEEQIRTTFIFLRNTGFDNIELDFSNCSYENKEKFLIQYIHDSIIIKYNEFVNTWRDILLLTVDGKCPLLGMLSIQEIQKFIERNLNVVIELLNFCISLPIYSLFRLKFNNELYSTKDIATNNIKIFGKNIYNVINHYYVSEIIQKALDSDIDGLSISFYTHYFTEENNELFNAINTSQMGLSEALFAMMSVDSKIWNAIDNVLINE